MVTGDILIPEVTSYFWKSNRFKTFDNWPFKTSDNCNAECMAAAGFYVIGDNEEPDLVECFICGKQLDGWEPQDDPWSEHVKHEPTCAFIKLNKQIEKEWTLNEMYDLYKKFKIKEYMHHFKKNVTTLKEEAAEIKNTLSTTYKTSQKSNESSE